MAELGFEGRIGVHQEEKEENVMVKVQKRKALGPGPWMNVVHSTAGPAQAWTGAGMLPALFPVVFPVSRSRGLGDYAPLNPTEPSESLV